MSTVIKVENLCKKYTLRHQQTEQYLALRDVITNGVKNFSKKLLSPFTSFTSYTSPSTETQEDFWALKDVSFEVKQGDRIGIIGRNGAGKSTLLKVLSRITEPTQGRITIKGRVASLLEVGTGFHPELTGRENIFLNGAILGMSRADIKIKFDEIVAFAEVEKFLDTPVKRYSSGMYVRLAFAVAAHLEPEILIVDEVLAVGDAQFQKKCLGKMEDVSAKEGRTVLFVSHNMGAVSKLCKKALLFETGRLNVAGPTEKIISGYLETFFTNKRVLLRNRKDRYGARRIKFIKSWTENKNGKQVNLFMPGELFKIVLFYEKLDCNVNIRDIKSSISFFSAKNASISLMCNYFTGDYFTEPIPAIGKIECTIPRLPLNEGLYYYNISIHSLGGLEDWVQEAGSFEIVSGDFYGTGNMPDRERMILIDHNWKIAPLRKGINE